MYLRCVLLCRSVRHRQTDTHTHTQTHNHTDTHTHTHTRHSFLPPLFCLCLFHTKCRHGADSPTAPPEPQRDAASLHNCWHCHHDGHHRNDAPVHGHSCAAVPRSPRCECDAATTAARPQRRHGRPQRAEQQGQQQQRGRWCWRRQLLAGRRGTNVVQASAACSQRHWGRAIRPVGNERCAEQQR